RLANAIVLQLVVGYDELKSTASDENIGFGWAPNLDMFAPVYGVPFAVDATPYDLDTRQFGLDASAQFRGGKRWNFNAGIRHDKAKASGNINGGDAGYKASHNSLNVGAMYISDYGVAP